MKTFFRKVVSISLIIGITTMWYIPQSVSAGDDSELTDMIITAVGTLTPKQIEKLIDGKKLVGKNNHYDQSIAEKTAYIENRIANLRNEAILQLRNHNQRIGVLNNNLRSTLEEEAAKLYTFDYVIYNSDADYVREQRRIYVEKGMRERQIPYADSQEYIPNYIEVKTQQLEFELSEYIDGKTSYDFKRGLSFQEKNIWVPKPIRNFSQLNTKQQEKLQLIVGDVIKILPENYSLTHQLSYWETIPDIGSEEYTLLEKKANGHLGGFPSTSYRWSSVVETIDAGGNWGLEWKNQFGANFHAGRNSWTRELNYYAQEKGKLLRSEKKVSEVSRINTIIGENNNQITQYLKKIKQLRSYDYVETRIQAENRPNTYGDFLIQLRNQRQAYTNKISTQQKRLEDYNREKILYEEYLPYRETLKDTFIFLRDKNPNWFQYGLRGRNKFYKKREEFESLLSQTMSPLYKDIHDLQEFLGKSNQKTGEEYLKTDAKTWEQYLAGNVSLASADKYLFEGRKNITAKLVNATSKFDKEISAIKASRSGWTQAFQNKLERLSLEAHQAKLHAYADWSVFYHRHPLVDVEDRSRKSQWLGDLLILEQERRDLVEEILRTMDIYRESHVSYALDVAHEIHNGSIPTNIPVFTSYGKDPDVKKSRKSYSKFIAQMPDTAVLTKPAHVTYAQVTQYNYQKEVGNFLNTMHYYNSEAGQRETQWINDQAAEDYWGTRHQAYMDETGIEISYQEFIRRANNVNGIGLTYPQPEVPTPIPEDSEDNTGSGSVQEGTGSGSTHSGGGDTHTGGIIDDNLVVDIGIIPSESFQDIITKGVQKYSDFRTTTFDSMDQDFEITQPYTLVGIEKNKALTFQEFYSALSFAKQNRENYVNGVNHIIDTTNGYAEDGLITPEQLNMYSDLWNALQTTMNTRIENADPNTGFVNFIRNFGENFITGAHHIVLNEDTIKAAADLALNRVENIKLLEAIGDGMEKQNLLSSMKDIQSKFKKIKDISKTLFSIAENGLLPESELEALKDAGNSSVLLFIISDIENETDNKTQKQKIGGLIETIEGLEDFHVGMNSILEGKLENDTSEVRQGISDLVSASTKISQGLDALLNTSEDSNYNTRIKEFAGIVSQLNTLLTNIGDYYEDMNADYINIQVMKSGFDLLGEPDLGEYFEDNMELELGFRSLELFAQTLDTVGSLFEYIDNDGLSSSYKVYTNAFTTVLENFNKGEAQLFSKYMYEEFTRFNNYSNVYSENISDMEKFMNNINGSFQTNTF